MKQERIDITEITNTPEFRKFLRNEIDNEIIDKLKKANGNILPLVHHKDTNKYFK
jgi:hypothetical protein